MGKVLPFKMIIHSLDSWIDSISLHERIFRFDGVYYFCLGEHKEDNVSFSIPFVYGMDGTRANKHLLYAVSL